MYLTLTYNIQDGSSELVLPWSMHCSVALMLVEAHSKLLPTQPGGRDYVPMASSLRNVSIPPLPPSLSPSLLYASAFGLIYYELDMG